jgi:hypothetical protein
MTGSATYLRSMLAALIAALGLASAASTAHAYTYVVHCNQFVAGLTWCPDYPSSAAGARHTYKQGRAASGAGSGTLYQYWYVAYTNSNASTYKYSGSGPIGSTLYVSFPNNSELLRGYTSPTGYGNTFGDGGY